MATLTDLDPTSLNEDLGSLFIGYTACCMCVHSSSFCFYVPSAYCAYACLFHDGLHVTTVPDGVVLDAIEGGWHHQRSRFAVARALFDVLMKMFTLCNHAYRDFPPQNIRNHDHADIHLL